ncbi:tetratricopeptide repeat protein [Tundrisphaera lichenicola]|uniref:tetratricopeptide repeat protein n=1 Tax=Tundrisphaera lichenicola TaxID=2029860 RepID=UPI003EBD2D15
MTKISPSSFIIETNSERFVSDVIERSSSLPVVVDFWATWCQPCRILGPTLEKLATEAEGKFILVKAETEKVPEIAAGFGVRSIPAVFAVRAGKVVDSFVGVLPEHALRDWIERIMPTPAEILEAEALGLESTDLHGAQAKYREALALDPSSSSIQVGLGRVALAMGRIDEARSQIEALERRGFLEPEAETLKAEITLRGKSGSSGEDLDKLREAHLADPSSKLAQLAFSEGLASAGKFDEALSLALDLVETDRRGTGEAARKLMIAIFQLLPADSEVASDYRRRLSFAL